MTGMTGPNLNSTGAGRARARPPARGGPKKKKRILADARGAIFTTQRILADARGAIFTTQTSRKAKNFARAARENAFYLV
jgi:hypothetical protein